MGVTELPNWVLSMCGTVLLLQSRDIGRFIALAMSSRRTPRQGRDGSRGSGRARPAPLGRRRASSDETFCGRMGRGRGSSRGRRSRDRDDRLVVIDDDSPTASYGFDDPRAVAATAGSPSANAVPVAVPVVNLVDQDTDAPDDDDVDPLCHKTQMQLLLVSKKQGNDFMSGEIVSNILSQIEGQKAVILDAISGSASFHHLHDQMRDALDIELQQLTGPNQRPGRFHYVQKLVNI